MNMKKKIRRAFQNATPNVLDRVLPEHSVEEKNIPFNSGHKAAPPIDKKTAKRDRFQEFVATAAALALLIGACGSGIWYLVRNRGIGNTGGLDSPATEAPRVAIEKDELYDQWITAAKCCVEPEDMDNITALDEYFSTTWDGEDAYVVSVTYKGYLYELTYSSSGLENMTIPQTDSIKEDEYITESAAVNIAYTQVEDSLPGTNFAWFTNGRLLDQYMDGSVCYYITLQRHPLNDFSNYEYKTFCIDAYTGQVLDVESFYTVDHENIESDVTLMNDLWRLVLTDYNSLTGYQRLNNTDTSCYVRNGSLIYCFQLSYGGYSYLFSVDATGGIISIEIADTNRSLKNHIALGVAQQIAYLAHEDQIDDGMYSTTTLQNDIYTINYRLSKTEVAFTCYVDAFTGSILDGPGPSLLDLRDIALAYHSIELENCLSLVMEYEDEGTENERVRVCAIFGTGVYVAAVRTSDGEIVDHYVLMTSEPEYVGKDGIVTWQDARNAALEENGICLEDLWGLDIGFDSDRCEYDFLFVCSDGEYTCTVDAASGQTAGNSFIGEEAAWAVMLEQMPPQVKDAYLAGALECHSNLYTDTAAPYYELWLTGEETYVAMVHAKTGKLIDLFTIVDEVDPPDGKLSEDIAIQQAIEALAGDDVTATVIRCVFTEGDEGDYYLVDYFAGGCYYRVAIGAYGAGHLWHEGYDYEDTLNGLSEKFSALGSWENMALTHTYDGPSQIDISILFYNGVGDFSALTAEELAFLKDAGRPEEFDVFRLPVRKINEILQTYFGCTLEDVDADTFRDVAYLESTDCYYLWHTGAERAEDFQAIGLIQDGDLYQMYYHLGTAATYVLTFESIGDGILIYSNLSVDLYE